MIYLLALVTAALIGILALRLIVKERLNNELGLFLGTALGLGIVGQIIFYVQLIGNTFNHFIPVVLSIILVGLLWFLSRTHKTKIFFLPKNPSLLILVALAIPLWFEANTFHNGGWDAWSCWNLKAKFIYLGEENWKDLFSPILWRSNTGYPLALPTINVWFWQWTGFSSDIPMYNAILLTLLTAGILLLGLQAFNVGRLVSILITVAIFCLPIGNTLCISQYSDILFSLYLLSVFVTFFLYLKHKDAQLLVLTGLFIGLLSFTKTEGLVAAGIMLILILLERIKKPSNFITAVIVFALPLILFKLFFAPKTEVFINGLLSSEKPSTLSRFLYILNATFNEFIQFKWMGLWIIAAVGLILGKDQTFKKPLLIIGFFLLAYLGVTIAYYQINTFFEDIAWWMNFTLNRIIYALMPCVFLWAGISLFGSLEQKKN